jgi:hypothetical protein
MPLDSHDGTTYNFAMTRIKLLARVGAVLVVGVLMALSITATASASPSPCCFTCTWYGLGGPHKQTYCCRMPIDGSGICYTEPNFYCMSLDSEGMILACKYVNQALDCTPSYWCE